MYGWTEILCIILRTNVGLNMYTYVYIGLFKAFWDMVKNKTYLWRMLFKGDDGSMSIDDNLCKFMLLGTSALLQERHMCPQ